ncbi:MAG: CmcJ/NvfI family oxidoreductase [Pseudomonadota bacterium]
MEPSANIYCQAAINYVSATGPVAVEQPILNGREVDTSVWQEGFELIELPSAVTDWTDVAAIESVHYGEIEQWAKGFCGCDAVLFYPALVRNPQAQRASEDFAPVMAAHSDYTEDYAAMIKDPDSAYHQVVRPSMLRAGVTDEALANVQRILTLQLWRNTGPELMDHPLAICDARSVSRSELHPLRVPSYGGLKTEFDAFGLQHSAASANHQWYTFPLMRQHEVLLFRAFDSEQIAREQPFWTPHTAFKDPHSNGVPRSSLEMRAICLFW